MSDWITLTSVEGGVCRLDRAQIVAYREGMFYDARDWAKKDSAPCRVVVAGGINIAVTETMDELQALIEGDNK